MQGLVEAVLEQGMESGDVGLEGAVGLHRHEAPLGSQTLALLVDETDVVGVDLRHHHGHVLRPAVGAVVGDHRALQPGVLLLQGPDLLLLHVHGAEDEVHHGGQLLRVRLRVQDHQVFRLLGDGGGHGPAGGDRLLIGLAGAAGAGGNGGELEPGVTLHQGDEALAHHAGAPDDTYTILLHVLYLLSKCVHTAAAPAGENCRNVA